MPAVVAYRIEDGGGLTPLYLEGTIQPDGTVDPLAGGYGTSAGTEPPPPAVTRNPHRDRAFAADSVFNLPAAETVQFKADTAPDQAMWIERGIAAAGGGIAQVNGQSTGYSIPIIDVTPLSMTEAPVVTLTHPGTGAAWAGASGVIRIPVDAMPPAGSDGSIHVRMPGPNGSVLAWDIYRAVKLSNTAWTSTSVDAIDIYGSGIVRGVSATNNALPGGMILQSELLDVQNGVRDDYGHPLRLSLPKTMLGPPLPDPGFTWPGNTRDSSAIVYSGQIRLGSYGALPTLDDALAAVGTGNIHGAATARTLYRYGWIAEDQSDFVALYVEPNWKRNPTTGLLTAPAGFVTTAEGQIKNAWRDHLMKRTRIVANNAPSTPNGGTLAAARRAALAPALGAWT